MSETFVPDGGIPLSLDESLRRIVPLQAEIKAKKALLDNYKKVAKIHMKGQNLETYESPEGTKAQFIKSQSAKYDKDAILTLTGEDFALCVSYSDKISFKVG
ncbi:MAG: hypothetical protein ACYSSM_04835 [Planctomycetota bacterium]|jgi:hypothetical protein